MKTQKRPDRVICLLGTSCRAARAAPRAARAQAACFALRSSFCAGRRIPKAALPGAAELKEPRRLAEHQRQMSDAAAAVLDSSSGSSSHDIEESLETATGGSGGTAAVLDEEEGLLIQPSTPSGTALVEVDPPRWFETLPFVVLDWPYVTAGLSAFLLFGGASIVMNDLITAACRAVDNNLRGGSAEAIHAGGQALFWTAEAYGLWSMRDVWRPPSRPDGGLGQPRAGTLTKLAPSGKKITSDKTEDMVSKMKYWIWTYVGLVT
eukprot:COSAG06_NODE_18303_length_894_cov_1.348428_1_plen_263_part_10